MFSVDRLTKWRTMSGSDNSGSGRGPFARTSWGRSSSTGRTGTSHGGSLAPLQPGLESSKINSVARRFLIKVFTQGREGAKKEGRNTSREYLMRDASNFKSSI